MATTYEFVVEELYEADDDSDIMDCPAFDTMEEARSYAHSVEGPWRICLRRDTIHDLEGITDRYYAYSAGGKLSDFMETATDLQDGPKVPKKYLTMDWSNTKNF
jgi:hypothetical protein